MTTTHEKRIYELRQRLPEHVDAALVTSPVNRYYLTGFSSSAGYVVVTRDSAVFITDFRYIEAARETARDFDVQQLRGKAHLPELLHELHVKSVAIEAQSMTVSLWRGFEKVLDGIEIDSTDALSKALSAMRMVKDAGELALMQKAQDITDAGFSHILGMLKPGVTERVVASELLHHMQGLGASGPSFDFIVASGHNASRPHAGVSDKPLEPGDFVTLDFGVVYEGYCSDMTRTVAIGHCTDEMARVYETVQQAQNTAFSHIKAGVNPHDVDTAAREVIAAAGWGDAFGHSLGHSLGLEVHESPSMGPADMRETFVPSMVTSVEPGIYLDGRFGVRIEDVVCITDAGYQNFARSDKSLLVLK